VSFSVSVRLGLGSCYEFLVTGVSCLNLKKLPARDLRIFMSNGLGERGPVFEGVKCDREVGSL
jgi:hypothetical protein